MSSPQRPSIEGRPGRPAPAGRPLRADAQRNRDAVLAAARAAFAAGTVSLEGIAREAGVGIGTLYRHFPTREALVEAVYADALDGLEASVADLLAVAPPEVALRMWMGRYAAFVATKRAVIDTLRTGWAAGRITTASTWERVATAIGTFLAAGSAAGSLRGDVDPDDVTALLLGAILSTAANDTPEQTERLLGLVVDALRPT